MFFSTEYYNLELSNSCNKSFNLAINPLPEKINLKANDLKILFYIDWKCFQKFVL